MAKQHIRFAKLTLDYFGEVGTSPEDFSGFLNDWSYGDGTILDFLGHPKTMEMLLAMIFKSRHRLKKDLLDPEFDRVAFFLEYQLNRPFEDLMNPFAGLFMDLPKELYKELADSSVTLSEMFVPQPSPWTQPGLFGSNKVELSHKPLPKPKLLPKPTHAAPSTLQ